MLPSALHPFLLSLLQGTASRNRLPSSTDAQAWEQLISQAADQQITALLYRWLQESGTILSLSQSQRSDLKSRLSQQTAFNLVLADELALILRACAKKGVPCIPIRGLALAEQLHGDIAARPMEDLDLLVHRETLPEVTEILRGLGFDELEHRPGFAQAYNYTLEFIKDRHGTILIEPHWTIAYPPFVDRVDMNAVWKRAVNGTVASMETSLLCPADLFLHLCCHLMHWRERAPLLWFYELDRVARVVEANVDWPLTMTLAEQSGQGFLVAQAAQDLRHLFATPIPLPSSMPRTQPAHSLSHWVAGRAERLLASECQSRGREEFALLVTLPGWRAKLRYAWPLLFPSPAFMRTRYGPAGWGLLIVRYCNRVLRLSWEGLGWLANLLALPIKPRHH